MSDLTSSLPVPTVRRLSSPVKMTSLPSHSLPLQEQPVTSRNIRTTMPAPFTKPKAESRKTLIERTTAIAKDAKSKAIPTERPRPMSATSHMRAKSTSTIMSSRPAVENRSSNANGRAANSRPSSVNSNRSRSEHENTINLATSSRTSSAAEDRTDSAQTAVKKVRRPAWDTKGRLEDMEEAYKELKDQFVTTRSASYAERNTISTELQDEREKSANLLLQKQAIQAQFESANEQIGKLQGTIHINRMEHEQLLHRHKMDLENEKSVFARSELQIRSIVADRDRDLDATRREAEALKQHLDNIIENKTKDICNLRNELEKQNEDLLRERKVSSLLKDQLAEVSAASSTLNMQIEGFKIALQRVEDEKCVLRRTITEREKALQLSLAEQTQIQTKLINEETQRRILHNQIQELKGNIRVFCRVRPKLASETSDVPSVRLPERADEIEVTASGAEMSLTGKEDKTYSFRFDKVLTAQVFGPESVNQDIFDELSQLVQSALDGYNVSIFAYGQTGSGKTHTMSSIDGMIPRAVSQIYKAATELKTKGWQYRIEGSFLEIYCETMRDLLATRSTIAKLEIRHDDKKRTTQVDGLTVQCLDSPSRVVDMLELAAKNRTVAATAANERSSRSHSVFILTLEGINEGTGERSRGVLNLIDLAGSERLNQSHASGERLKETQAINKSLSCLADVIYALGSDQGHIPYRNSKLTYLLQNSLGGNSKTLMFVNVSPLREHAGESICSLRFATKVNATQIGTAKAQKNAIR